MSKVNYISFNGSVYCFSRGNTDIQVKSFDKGSKTLKTSSVITNVPSETMEVKFLFDDHTLNFELFALTKENELYVHKNGDWNLVVGGIKKELSKCKRVLAHGPRIIFYTNTSLFVMSRDECGNNFSIHKLENLALRITKSLDDDAMDEGSDSDLDIFQEDDEKEGPFQFNIVRIYEFEILLVNEDNQFVILDLKTLRLRPGSKYAPNCFAKECVSLDYDFQGGSYLSLASDKLIRVKEGLVKSSAKLGDGNMDLSVKKVRFAHFGPSQSYVVVEYFENFLEMFHFESLEKINSCKNVECVLIDDFMGTGSHQMAVYQSGKYSIWHKNAFTMVDSEGETTLRSSQGNEIQVGEAKHLQSIANAIAMKVRRRAEEAVELERLIEKKKKMGKRHEKFILGLVKKYKGDGVFNVMKPEKEFDGQPAPVVIKLRDFVVSTSPAVVSNEVVVEKEKEEEVPHAIVVDIKSATQGYTPRLVWDIDMKLELPKQTSEGGDFTFIPFSTEKAIDAEVSYRDTPAESSEKFDVNLKCQSMEEGNSLGSEMNVLLVRDGGDGKKPSFKHIGQMKVNQKDQILGIARTVDASLPDLHELKFIVKKTDQSFTGSVYAHLKEVFCSYLKFSVVKEDRDFDSVVMEMQQIAHGQCQFAKITTVLEQEDEVEMTLKSDRKSSLGLLSSIIKERIPSTFEIKPLLFTDTFKACVKRSMSVLKYELEKMVNENKIDEKKMNSLKDHFQMMQKKLTCL